MNGSRIYQTRAQKKKKKRGILSKEKVLFYFEVKHMGCGGERNKM